jgi:LysM repeat protein
LKRTIAPFIVLLLLATAHPGRADEVVRYTVRRGDTCSSIARQFYGDADMVAPIHDANDMKGPPPHHLLEGAVLVIPSRPASASGPDAKLTAVRNRVEVQTPETKPGKVNDPLFRGNRVATGSVSSAGVMFRNETQLRLGEQTLVVILGDARASADKASTVATNLVTGSLRAWMSKSPDMRAAVSTQAANVRVIGGETQVTADEKKTTRVAVYKGNSAVTAVRKTADVGAGYGSKVENGKAPAAPRPLPIAPIWRPDVPNLLVDRGSATAFVAEFDPAVDDAHAVSWHIQIARDAEFRDVLVDQTVPRETRRIEAPSPAPGRYYARVSAVDDDHFEGPFGRQLSFGVLKIASTPRGEGKVIHLEPAELFCVRIGNTALSRVLADITLARNEPMLLRCSVSESEPTTLVTVAP